MRTGIFVLSLFFVVWCFVSARWYVCGIKQLCEDGTESTSPVWKDEILTENKPIQFAWSDNEVIVNDGLSNWRDSIFTLFEGSGPGRLVISGLYYPNEENNSQDVNLGLARAHAAAEWLMQEGFNYPIDLKSSLKQEEATTAGQNVGIEFEIVEVVQTEAPIEPAAQAYVDPVDEVQKKPKPMPVETAIISTGRNRFLFSANTLEDEVGLERQIQDIIKRIKPVKGNLLVIGHSANSGDALADKKMGLRLASKVSEMLVSNGIDDAKVLTESAGSDQASGGRHSNRVEIVVQ